MFIASFLCHMWLFGDYQSNRPPQPQPEIGRIYPLSNHGTIVYITDVEATELYFLFFALFPLLGSAGFCITSGKGLENPTRKQWLVALAAAACYLIIAIDWGRQIAAFAVSRGTILSLG
jgi:hypothetical protein